MNVRLYGTLSSYVHGYDHEKGVDVVIGEGTTIADLISVLSLPVNVARLFFVKGLSQKLTYQLNDQDEISIFLPMAGG